MNWEEAKKTIKSGGNIYRDSRSYYTLLHNKIVIRVFNEDINTFITKEIDDDIQEDKEYCLDIRSEEDMEMDIRLSRLWMPGAVERTMSCL